MPRGIFSMPKTSTVSWTPAAICWAPRMSAAPPLAQPASTFTIGTPESPSAVRTLWPAATPPYTVPQNAAWKPPRATSASASAARTAWTPSAVTLISAKRPNGWMPTPAT